MKLQKYNFKIGKSKQAILNKNVSFPIYDYRALFYYVNYRDITINNKYRFLLPFKISDLKTKKNELLQYREDLRKLNETNFKEERINLFEKLPQVFKSLNLLCDWIKTEQKFKKYAYRNQKKIIINKEIEIYKSDYYRTDYLLQTLKFFIDFLEDKIKFYQTEKERQNDLIDLKINSYDLLQFEKGIITNNINSVFHYYIIKQQKTTISRKTSIYLNSQFIKSILKNYSNMDNKEGIKNDFDLIAKNDLIKFETLFLSKMI
jgi:hypothetical protein